VIPGGGVDRRVVYLPMCFVNVIDANATKQEHLVLFNILYSVRGKQQDSAARAAA
jgi:hypothetical protein